MKSPIAPHSAGTPPSFLSDYETFDRAWEYVLGSTSPPSIEVNLRFPGQYLDRETGLHYNWNRYYDPNTGRYLTPDPLAAMLPEFALVPFAYGHNNPLMWVDPTGLCAKGLGCFKCCNKEYNACHAGCYQTLNPITRTACILRCKKKKEGCLLMCGASCQ